jgi:eukaryotic-like serine/threonine-protein kinase
MNVIKRMQANRYARQLQSSQELTPTAISEAQNQLLALGPDAIRSILESLHGEPARGPALQVLERLVSNTTLPAFVAALRSPDAAVVESATNALSQSQGYDPTQLLPLFGDQAVSKARVESILSARMKAIQPRTLLQLLPDMSRDARGSVFRLLEKRADSSIVGEAVRMAVHTEWWLRLHMVKLLSKFPSEESNTVVTKLLGDDNPAVRMEAVRTLAVLKEPKAIPALCARLRDTDIKVQTAAIEALIEIKDVRAVSYLLEYLQDESEYVRRGAVEVLNNVVTVEAIKDLVTALRDVDWWVRVRAADALGTLGGERVVEAVIALLDDADDFVRRYAVEILNMVSDTRAVEPLIRALDDNDWWVRERAIDALAKARDPRAVDPLLRTLSRDARAIPLCVRALTEIGDARAVEPICRLATSENNDVRRVAIESLTKFAKLELPSDVRDGLYAALESAGVSAGRGTPLPFEGRSNMGPESGREDPDSTRAKPRPTESGGTPARGPDSPTHMYNFQRLEPGILLMDRWRVIRRIGGGGFGTVYLVEDAVVREELVLKILSQHLSLDESMIRRFVQELKLTRRITHKNVIRIYDLLDLNGAHAISMEYFAGRDLGQTLREDGPLTVPRALNIASQVLEGLQAAHDLGIVHRDIKPGNLLLGPDDTTKIVDFGLAAVGQTTRSRLTQSGILVGTPEYISPEQITGKEVDGRTDLYSLGCVLYQMISGKEPFAGESAVNILFQHLEGEVPSLISVAPHVPEAVSELVGHAMSRDASLRPATANDMLEALATLRKAA